MNGLSWGNEAKSVVEQHFILEPIIVDHFDLCTT